MKYDNKKINFIWLTAWDQMKILQNGFLGGVNRVLMYDSQEPNTQQRVVGGSRKEGKNHQE